MAEGDHKEGRGLEGGKGGRKGGREGRRGVRKFIKAMFSLSEGNWL